MATDATGALPDNAVEAVESSFPAVLEQACASIAETYDHDEALRAEVQSAYPAVQLDSVGPG